MSIYDIPDMVGRGFPRAFTPVNTQSGFKVAGMNPFDRDIFADAEFLLSDVTDRPIPVDVGGGVSTQLTDQQATSQQHQISDMSSPSRIDCPTIVTTENIRSFRKAAPRNRKSNINRGKTRILTDTPENNELMVQARKKKKTSKKIYKRLINASKSDSDEELPPLLSDEEDSSDGSTIDGEEMTEIDQPSDSKEGEFPLVKFSARKRVQFYVRQVIDVFEAGGCNL